MGFSMPFFCKKFTAGKQIGLKKEIMKKGKKRKRGAFWKRISERTEVIESDTASFYETLNDFRTQSEPAIA